MRQALFAVMLVAASFAGGAVVNGPGLRWAQAVVLNRLGSDGEGGGGETATPPGPGGSAPAEEIPARPIPPLVIPALVTDKDEAKGPKAEAGPGAEATPRAVGRASRREPGPREDAPTAARDSAAGLPGLAPVSEGMSAKLDELPPLEPSPVLTSAAPPGPPVQDVDKGKEPARDQDKPPGDAPVRRASLADAAAPAGDWAEVRDTMRALGVSRYGVEGEPGGRVRFHCVIPLAGRRAVGQHFEAEADDDLQAARAALKRVALWKATEAGGGAP